MLFKIESLRTEKFNVNWYDVQNSTYSDDILF